MNLPGMPALYIPLPGDILLYSGTGFNSWLIKTKTWSKISHSEMVAGEDSTGTTITYASRDGQGVNTYKFSSVNLVAILRANKPLDWPSIDTFHKACIGQTYDWWGLLRFFSLGNESSDKQFCSEYVTRLLRIGGFEPFHSDYPADEVAPGTFLLSPILDRIWLAKSISGEATKGIENAIHQS